MNLEKSLSIVLDDHATAAERMSAVERIRAEKASAAIIPLTLELPRVEDDLKDAIRLALDDLDATAIIAEDLSAPDEDTRIKAAEMMALVPAPAGVQPLIRALTDSCPKVRELAASALWLYADTSAIAPLAHTLAEDPHPDVRSAAAQSLGHLGTGVALEALEMAHDREADDFTRILISDALTRIRDSV